ncbi:MULTISPECIES: hypothetical protein [Winogradskyella]|uniref:hypothetical protein n=1 Tax=Winogradskyella TaxID=286104 RepID=UPI0015CB20ED|nr:MULTISPECIES: hypothetical protein [Winogradskyella]QXP79100.1 hypothetical protein H0I32_00155 [Winogradskyella sp. HaHa_3_26]
MKNSRDAKRNIISKLKKGKFSKDDFIGQFKYNYSQEQRDYILAKVSKRYTNYAYNNPLPKEAKDIASIDSVLSSKSDIYDEIIWYFEVLYKYAKEINSYLDINENIQISILNNDLKTCYDLLTKLENEVCFSYYGLQTKLYINELNGETEYNKELIKEIPLKNNTLKLLVLLEFTRLRVDKSISSWQYDASIEQHKKGYSQELKNLIDYVDFKLKPARYVEKGDKMDLQFIAFYESNFSVIDRYNSLKKLLPLALFQSEIKQDKLGYIYQLIEEFAELFKDNFWNKLLITSDRYKKYDLENIDCNIYLNIESLFFEGLFEKVVEQCELTFKNQPHFSDLYIFYIKSLIYTNRSLENAVDEKSELYSILILIQEILIKTDAYTNNREKLLEKYYSISHFNFSTPILEFLFNEYRLDIPDDIKKRSYLESKSFRYNSYAIFDDAESYTSLNLIGSNVIFDYLKNFNDGKDIKESNFFKFRLKVGFLMSKNKIDEAIQDILSYSNTQKELIIKYKFIDTWICKTLVKAYLLNNQYSKISDLITDKFFKDKVAYDHFFDQEIINSVIDLGDYDEYKNISIPNLFEIYQQSQSLIYDRIADFLIANDLEKPSEIFTIIKKFNLKNLIHFLERVCTMENIQDSPYLNSITVLESERIKILNFLKTINKEQIEPYNSEILKITKGASLRKGLLQIHESRIYIDTNNIIKHLAIELPEIFDRYLELTDITYPAITSLKFNEEIGEDNIVVTFFFKEPISEKELPKYLETKDPRLDPNAVTVPLIRYHYFLDIFSTIRQEFIYSEDYGFRSFLSMRIRHGTFSNVLRSVFDKYYLISSKESNKDEYKEILFWNDKLEVQPNTISQIQQLLKDFSRNIDALIEDGLSWINIKNSFDDNYMHIFDFNFSQGEMYALYHNRMGKIEDYDFFILETFNVLYGRLEICLSVLRRKIGKELALAFLNKLEELENNITEVAKKEDQINPIKQEIISCKTDIQVIISQMLKWFKVSENQYIEEFPLEMIFQNSLDYINSIHTNSINIAQVKMDIECDLKFKGKYFESFGDMLINIFDNIISKNKDLGSDLKINIKAVLIKNNLEITIKNNLSKLVNKADLKARIKKIIQNVADYKNEGINSSFEEGSGFLKICKCISVDLEREDFILLPKITKNDFEVKINFELNKLVI